ncbi:MAG: glycoside hydrolase family 3 C-terminal domain-containing protein [Treponema sp.]|nr:glycoside hydrolase family 3 C-terminal domain-containing protein [Treponema sp.]
MKITLDWKKYEQTAREAIAEGCVLLENKNHTLPLETGAKVAVFGRIQSSYYKSGTGSGGKVNVDKVYNIVDGLLDAGIVINQKLQNIYTEWEKTNPFDEGLGWGKERWSQDEMPLTAEIVADAAKESDIAIVIIGRTAGEDKDNSATKGSYLLSDEEEDMIAKVRAGFSKMVVLLNVGNIIDMSFVEKYHPDSVMYVWQGGMLGGLGTADVLTGKTPACGKLTDTIAKNISDYPTDKYFGNPQCNFYAEDIFTGYRYFEASALTQSKVTYPFGYGLTYSSFNLSFLEGKACNEEKKLSLSMEVKNTGNFVGKEVVQIYIKAPNGKLGKAARSLVDFEKTKLLEIGKSQKIEFNIPYYNFASYDDSGITGNKSCFVLENGMYQVFAGFDVRSAREVFSFEISGTTSLVVEKCTEAMAPGVSFERMHALENGTFVMETVPTDTGKMSQRRLNNLPKEIPQIKKSDDEINKLEDVLNKKITMEDFVAQFTDYDLSCIIRGEGMGSSLVTPGTASAFGGVSERLRNIFGIPAVCCDDGPSGMRLDCGIKAFALPSGTSLACTFNRQLITDLYTFTGIEMSASHVENLLGPGMNIHRHPLNGRNFEYFSEDPLVTGEIGSAMLKGLHQGGVTGTIKHFAGNEQETNRRANNSVASERAWREIYLRGFEIAVRSGWADSIMTTYGLANGIYTAGNYDLNTSVLRGDWHFSGIVMTDWWAAISEPDSSEVSGSNFAGMIKAQNDLYMVCPDGATNASGDNTLEALADGRVTRAELQRSAMTICNHVMHTQAMKRLMGTADEIEIINRPASPDDIKLEDVEIVKVGKEITIDLTYQECKANTNYVLAFDVEIPGTYEFTLTGSSELNEVAQLPCTFFYQGIPIINYTFNGTNGKDVSITKISKFPTRFSICRLFVSDNGLNLKSIKLKFLNDDCKFDF